MAPKQNDPQFKLRLTPELKRAIDDAAYRNGRSINAEILSRLEETFNERRFPDLSGAGFAAIVKVLEATVEGSQKLFEDIREEARAIAPVSRWETEDLGPAIDVAVAQSGLRRSQLMTMIIKDWLKENGYLGEPQEDFDVNELAAIWSVPASRIRHFIKEGELHAEGKGKSMRISRSSIDAFIARRRFSPQEEPHTVIERLRA